MPKMKKGKRRWFKQSKTKQHTIPIKSQSSNPLSTALDAPKEYCFKNLQAKINGLFHSCNWIAHTTSDDFPQYPVVSKCLTVFLNLKWQIAVMGKTVPETNFCYNSVPQVIHSFNDLMNILQNFDTAAVCGGNPDIFMVETVQDILTNSNRNIPVYIDATMTVRHKDGLLLVAMLQKQCSVCCKYRNYL